jgi:hypothetical protein
METGVVEPVLLSIQVPQIRQHHSHMRQLGSWILLRQGAVNIQGGLKVQAAFIERETKPQLKEKSTPGAVAPASNTPAYEQQPREIEPIAEKAKAATANEQQPFFE